MDPLENPVWHALEGAQAPWAEQVGRARRFDPAVSVFGALPDDPTSDDWDALAELVGPGRPAMIVRAEIPLPDGWSEGFGGIGFQMHAIGSPADGARRRDGAAVDVVELGPDDVADMVDLVARTEPGPFTDRTHELGTYLGVRSDDGRLVAMAGERMRPPGHVEISAVCTDPEWQGRGLARMLVAAVVARVRADGDVPILHVTQTNTRAIELYRSLGFETVRPLRYVECFAPTRSGSVAVDADGEPSLG